MQKLYTANWGNRIFHYKCKPLIIYKFIDYKETRLYVLYVCNLEIYR